MKKNILLFVFTLLSTLTASAQTLIDGIYYYLYSSNNTAQVTSNPDKYAGSITIPETVTYNGVTYRVAAIEGRAFEDCLNLTSVTIPNSVTEIRNYAFKGCSSLPSITIPNSVTSIGERAFAGCSGLTSVTIPNSVNRIGSYAFNGCSGLTSVHITDLEAWCKISFGSYSNPLSCAKHLYMDGKEIKDLVIPNSVTSIGDWTFYGCSGLTSVTIPNNVTSIGSWAFHSCSGLTSVTIPNNVKSIKGNAFYGCSGMKSITIGNSVTSIGTSAFQGCSGMTSIEIPNSVTSIGSNAFSACYSLASIEIPNSVTSIEYSTFSLCRKLTSITIPNSVTSIGSYAFSQCDALTSITIPNSVLSIGESAFYSCRGLTSMEIPNSVTSIGGSAFSSCSGLESVTIPNSVTSIGRNAFSYCSSLTSVTCKATSVPSTEKDLFYNVPQSSATLYVPSSALETYKATAPWSGFGSFVPIDDEPVATGITINETNFPDENFRNWILLQDYGKDGVLTEAEIADVKIIDVSDKNIQSLKGIEYFTSLTELRCGGNQLTSLDVSNNTALTMLYCYGNQLTSLDVSNNTALKALSCLGNQLTSLDISKNTELTVLYCQSNQLTSLDISKNTKLKGLYCYNNQLTSLDVSKNTELIGMYCYSNQIYGTAMDALVASLPNIVSEYIPGSGDADGTMRVIYDENEGNVITTTQVAAAKAKGWIPQYFNGKYWLNYAGSEPTPKEKCATPTISFVGGKIVFDCETEGVEFVSEVTCSDSGKYNSSEIPVTSTYTVSVYAKKDGYEDSDVATKEITVGGSTGIKADVNEDGNVNGTDIQEVINIIVNAE